MNPPNLFLPTPQKNLVQHSVATELKHTSPGGLQKSAHVQFVRQRRATQIRISREELEENFLGRLRSRILECGPASCGTGFSQRTEPCWICYHLSLHLPTETLRRQHFWPTARGVASSQCQRVALRARFVARPLSVDKMSNNFSPRLTNILPLNERC